MRTTRWQRALILISAAMLVSSATMAGERARRSGSSDRGHARAGRASGSAVSGRATHARPGPSRVTGRASAGRAATRVSGHATYGYGGRHVVWDPWYWGPYGWAGVYGGWYWGWPYYGWWGGPWQAPVGVETIRVGPDSSALIETAIRPKKAEVLLDGTFVGQARDYNGSWDALDVKPGLRQLEFRQEGYQTLRLWIDASPGRAYTIRERLRRGEGLDDRSMERPAEPAHEAAPAPDRRAAPAPRPPRHEAAIARGLIRIEASPRDAAVYLDGEFLADAGELERLHGALPVAEGRHVVEVVRPGFVSQRLEVDVTEDEPTHVVVKLERDETR